MPIKNNDNTQIGRVSTAAGNSPIAVAPPNDGLAPLLDNNGRLITVPFVGGSIISAAPTFVDSQAVVLWRLISAASCKLFQGWGAQNSGGLLWLQLFNLAAGPPGGAVVPRAAPIPVPNQGVWSLTFADGGLSFSTGLVIAYSTTQSTYTAPIIGGWISGLIR
jgi:hypothetical protein